jgi:DNA-binding protein H-NS
MAKIEQHAEIIRIARRWLRAGLTATAGTLLIEEQQQRLQDAINGPADNVKYRLGELSWSGRGRKPKWIHEQLKAGRRLEEFLVH